MTNAFLSALKAQAVTVQATRAEAPKVEAPTVSAPVSVPVVDPIDDSPIVVNVELVLDRNRIDVRFSRAPDVEVLQLLKSNDWQFKGAEKRWYHQDNAKNRAFCVEQFGAQFDEPEETIPEAPEPIEVAPSAEYVTYKRKVNALIEYTGMDAADLMLAAVDALYREVFGKPN